MAIFQTQNHKLNTKSVVPQFKGTSFVLTNRAHMYTRSNSQLSQPSDVTTTSHVCKTTEDTVEFTELSLTSLSVHTNQHEGCPCSRHLC